VLNAALAALFRSVNAMESPRVLEVGSRRTPGRPSSLRRHWVPNACEHVGFDFQEGDDVDVVGDVHRLSRVFPENRFDVILACSTLEHVRYPWIAARELMFCLRFGGVIFIQTHQSYPLHGAPFDYWRFSKDALDSIFHRGLGLEILASCHEFPCRLISDEDPQALEGLEAYLNSCLCAVKVAPTPDRWSPEL
jgi:SAM-dependent methyltransferase